MSTRSYQAFLKAVKKKHGITHKQAQKAYRRVSSRLNRPARGVDVRDHPRILRDSLNKKRRSVAKGSPKKGHKKTISVAKRIRTIEQWEDLYDDAVLFETEDVVSSADYGDTE